MDVHPVMQKVNTFHKNHGEECYSDGTYHYYADGAYRDVNPLGVLAEPPDSSTAEGEWLCETNKLKFATLKLQTAVDEFERENERLCRWVPNDPEIALKNLKRLQKLIDERKELVRQMERRLNNTRWGKRREEIRKEEEESRQRFAEFQQKRRAIRI